MQLDNLKKNVDSLGNMDINFFLQQVENLNNKTDIEIVFSGTISNGKSTLINALLGIDLLPMELGATTSLVTTLQKGSDNILATLSDGSSKNYPLNKSSIKTISEDLSIDSISITLENFSYNGIKFVDTPGINDISQTREGKTYNYVPLADVVVFVVDASKGLTNEEAQFFESKVVKANKDKIFIVLNKIDTISDEEIVLDKLLSSTITNDYSVYKISALKYLVGILKNDVERIEESGVQQFKDDLDSYLKTLNKSKILKTRMQKSLENILNLATIQIDTLLNNVSKDKPELETQVNNAQIKIKELNNEKNLLEKEMNSAIKKIEECVYQNLNVLKNDINTTIKNVSHQEFMIDKFNEQVPLLCARMMDAVKECSEEKLKGLELDFKELDELYLWVIRNIDDVMAQLAWLLTFVPKFGKIITPFIPKVQETVRKLVDMFSGKIIQKSVEDKVKELLNSIENTIKLSITNYKNTLLSEYEHNQLGIIRSELISLENLLSMHQYKKDNIEHQVKYYKESKDTLSQEIENLLIQNDK